MEKWELTVRLGLDLRTATDQEILDALLKANPEAGLRLTKLKTNLPYREEARGVTKLGTGPQHQEE